MAREPKKKAVTKKEISRLKREQRQRRFILLGAILVLVLVSGVIILGVLNEYVFKGMRAVARVNEQSISLEEFQKEVLYQRLQLTQRYLSIYQLYQNFGGEGIGQSFLENLVQLQNNLSQENEISFGKSVLDQLIDNSIIHQYAGQNNIEVSEAEIDKALQSAFLYYPDGTPTSTITPTSFVTSTLSSTQSALASATPSATATKPPESTPTSLPENTASPSEAATSEPTISPTINTPATPTNTLEPTLTSTPYTLEGFQTRLSDYVASLKEIELSEKDLRSEFEKYLLRQKVFDAITGDIKPEQEQVWARHILVKTKQTAQEILLQLKYGVDWTSMAAQYSTDQANKKKGGDLGWFGKDKMVAAFEEVAFQLEIGEISNPVQTDSGWHVIQVLGHEVRPISSSLLDSLKQQTFREWLDSQITAESVQTFENWYQDIPRIPTIPPDLIIETPTP